MPLSKKIDDDSINVTQQYELIFELGFWLCLIQAFLCIPSIKSATVQKLLCFLLIPDLALFIFMNVAVLS